MMEIKRHEMADAFQRFARAGSGIVVGPPGVGKTHLLKTACAAFHDEGIPFLYLPLDRLGGDAAQDPGDELGLGCPLTTYLQAQKTCRSDRPGILIIDAFDATRSENQRKHLLALISRVRSRFGGTWNVILSARTYDARHSGLLQTLFPPGDGDPPDYRVPGISCRHFAVPRLTGSELQAAIESNLGMRAAVSGAPGEFQELLRIPFNLVLLERLIDHDPGILGSTPIRTETELLDLVWDRLVLAGDQREERRALLTRLTRRMVEQHTLSLRREEVGGTEGVDDLLDAGVLIDASLTGQRVAYAHPILFDHAVSTFLIGAGPRGVVEFIAEEPARGLFLWPGLYHYFTRLWLKEPDTFWEVFWQLQEEPDPGTRLFGRLLSTSVLVREARSMDQVLPLLTADPHAILQTLQALRVSQGGPDALWAGFLRALVDRMDETFAREVAIVTAGIVARAENDDPGQVLPVCGEISRTLLAWVLEHRNGSQAADSLGAGYAVPLVARTYATDPERSRALLEVVVHKEDLPPRYLAALADHVARIWPHDPDLAALISRVVWTPGGEDEGVCGCTGDRQDLRMCRCRLMKSAPDFLRDEPEVATRAMVECLNRYIIENYLGDEAEGAGEEFRFRGGTARYVPDGSHIWGDERGEVVQMADTLTGFIGDLASSERGRAEIPGILDIFQEHARAAYLWRRLIILATHHPEVLAEPLFDLCVAPPVMEHDETGDVLMDLLAVAAPFYTDEQVHQIEEAILEMPGGGEGDPDCSMRRRDRLLTRIPPDRLRSDKAREIRAAMTADYLAALESPLSCACEDDRPGPPQADTAAAEPERYQALLKFTRPLDAFREEWRDRDPTPESISRVLPVARGLWEEVDGAGEPHAAAWTSLASSLAVMSRGVRDPQSDAFRFCRNVLLRCATLDLVAEPGAFRSSAPREEAASGLVALAAHGPDPAILAAIERLSRDPAVSVRYRTMQNLSVLHRRSPETFWRIVEERCENEQERAVLKALCYNLEDLISHDRERVERALEVLVRRVIIPDDLGDPLEPLIHLLVRLDLIDQDARAGRVTERFLAEPSRYAGSLLCATSAALSLLRSSGGGCTDRVVGWLERAVAAVADGVRTIKPPGCGPIGDERVRVSLRSLYETIDRIVLHLGAILDETPDPAGASPAYRQKGAFYFTVKPLLEKISSFAQDPENRLLFAPTAPWFVRLLNSVLAYDPEGVIRMAADLAWASRPAGCHPDLLASDDLVSLVETALADHPSTVAAGDLLRLLDLFAEGQDPRALRRVWRLDEVYG